MFQKMQDEKNGVRHQQTRCVMETPSSSSTAKVTPLLDKSVFTINFLTLKLHMTRIEMLMLNALKHNQPPKRTFLHSTWSSLRKRFTSCTCEVEETQTNVPAAKKYS